MRLLPIFLWIAGASLMSGSVIYDESMTGDLSNDWTAPKFLAFGPGSNQVLGSLVRVSSTTPDDKDYFTFTIPSGYHIDAINVLPGTVGGGSGVSFFGIASGTSVMDPSTTPNSTLAASLLGYTLYGSADVGSSILNRLANSNASNPAAQGFTTLGPGNYSIWIQEGFAGTYPYGFDFVVVTPEPGPWLLGLVSVAMMVVSKRRRAFK
jgi:hypothetical protein